MTGEFRVPKRKVTAQITLPGQPPARFGLFLGEGTGTHAGRERPSDILNGSRGFLPAIDARGGVILLNSSAVMVVSVAAENEFDTAEPRAEDLVPDRTTRTRVEVTLANGTFLRGTISYLMPEAQSRLQDFLNLPERFVALREDGVAHLINKDSITRILSF